MDRRFPRFRIFLIVTLFVVAVAFLSRGLWLPVFGWALVHNDGPAKTDIIVVLGGDYYGLRILKAAELIRNGYAPKALISGPPGFYGFHESDLALRFAEQRGFPKEWFISFPNEALSTREEAQRIVAELRRRNARSCLIVTSDFHTARAARLYRWAERAAGGGPTFRMVAAPDEFFRADSWWRTRQSQKTVFFEWTKTLATAVGM